MLKMLLQKIQVVYFLLVPTIPLIIFCTNVFSCNSEANLGEVKRIQQARLAELNEEDFDMDTAAVTASKVRKTTSN